MSSVPIQHTRSGNPVQVLLSNLIDDMGLFAATGLPMAEALRQYANCLHGQHGFALGRFVLPMHRLAEFEFAYTRLPNPTARGWQLSVLAGVNPVTDSVVIRDFNSRHQDVRISAIETKAKDPDDVASRTAAFSPDLEVWMEIPDQVDPRPFIREIRKAGRGAKLRTGGVSAASLPSPAYTAQFLIACRAERIVAKATHGLQQPVAGHHQLQITPDNPAAVMNGFLNIVLAAALLRAGGTEAACIELLNDTDSNSFVVVPGAITWRGYWFGADELAAARRKCFRSFGSNNFSESIDGMRKIGWL
jgi:hypothetical protein